MRFLGLDFAHVEMMMEENCAPYYPSFHTQLYELGKYVDFNDGLEPFYTGFNIQSDCEAEFHIMRKPDLKKIIEEYSELIWGNYIELAKREGSCWDDEKGEKDCVQRFLERRAREWNNPFMTPYRLDEPMGQDGEIAGSWQYEYAIFNLVYIYRTFDWDNDYMIYSGW
jgi:hypothetical protein